ncbi:CheR family methyltransferase [Bordetella avium]|uniref:CheR family methyltransferase n=1 Tax=Bordetella avium TaxID=521 RepID=UPI000E09E822|nr:protein-glutamate O-methyltransferase CheR [Bordetella avium]AZY48523.1 chemotaxis protein CheR [Bordetella avium]RIQ13831.1 chemotaxis protein CheR [Bordetella avium]RIQ39527.1 chemotaxis protein CheR [Bordetella avium]RIQ44326.1 chemotaxis protein CheR [Bordetella avium]RIQ45456.1 chemotaxis protein CheR [Bordetella avium]
MIQPDFPELLKRRIGLDTACIGEAAVSRAVRLRMQASGVDDEASYWTRLLSSEEEMQQLIEAVVVPETWFFRYPESLKALAGLALRHRGELRILSLPCSTGEEPYSIAMALLDAGLKPEAFRIDGVDVSERALAVAQAGRYGRNAFRGGEQGFRLRYFDAHGQLSRAVMNCVRFMQGNLFDPVLQAGLPGYDVLFCRNLLIYFDSTTQARALATLTRMVSTDGAIFVGPAEASLLTARGYPALAGAGAFAFSARPAPMPALRPRRAPDRSSVAALSQAAPRPPAFSSAVRLLPVPPPASPPVDAAQRDAALQSVAALADQGRLDEAWAASEAFMAKHGASAGIWYLRGLIKDAGGQVEAAHDAYRKALYLDPAHRQAMLQLAALLHAEGKQEASERLSARARRLGP